MDFDQLITFLEVARQGSFSRAGEKVFRSQSAVSAQIRQLEQEYGDRLLDRSGKTVKLTPAGRRLFARMAAAHEQWVVGLFAGLAAGEKEQVYRLLAKLKLSLEKETRK